MINVPPKNTIRYRFVDALSSQKLAAPSKSNGRARRATGSPPYSAGPVAFSLHGECRPINEVM